MIAAPPSVLLEELPEQIGDLLPNVSPRQPLARMSEDLGHASRLYRALAISRLVVEGETEGFHGDLVRSARLRLYFLSRCQEESFQHFEAVTGRSESLFDSLAAGEIDLAKEIAVISPSEWREGDEYEDDFCQAHFVHRLLLGAETEELMLIMEQFEAALEGAASPRLELCRALLAQSQTDFDPAFSDLLGERAAKIAEDKERFLYEVPEVVTDRLIFVEALAFLRLAEHRVMETAEEYPYCPALARVPATGPLPGAEFPRW